jgi:hypothetical protein
MNRLTNYCCKWILHAGWYPDTKLRLWKKSQGKWEGMDPHDRFVMKPACTTGWLRGNLLHYSFHHPADHRRKSNQFAAISARAYLEAGKRANRLSPWIHAVWKFFKTYLLKLGFLDGFSGWRIARESSRETFMKYRLLLQLLRNQ